MNGLLRDAAAGPPAGIPGYEERPLVSVGDKGDSPSVIVDARSMIVVNGTHVKVSAWDGNESGCANRLIERLVRRV